MGLKSALSTKTTAVLDACVMLQSYLLDVLLTAAERGVFDVYWSRESLAELEEQYIRIRSTKHGLDPGEARDQIQRKINAMKVAFPGATVSDLGELENLNLRDPDDRHVLAAAIQAGAAYIVTHNLRDYPKEVLDQHGVALQSPDGFLLQLLDAQPDEMADVVRYISVKTRKPHLEVEELLARLAKSTPRFAARVTAALHSW